MDKKKDAPEDGSTQASNGKLAWVVMFPIWHNRVVIRQLGLVFFIPLGVLFVILALVQWPLDGEALLVIGKIILIVAAVLFVLLLIGTAVVSLGGYEVAYRLDDKGIGGQPHGRTAKKNTLINFLLILSGRPGAMGAGMLAQSRQVEYVAWKDVDRIETDPQHRTITLYRGKRPLMVVACDEAHYDAVLRKAKTAVVA